MSPSYILSYYTFYIVLEAFHTTLEGIRDINTNLKSDMKTQNMEFDLLIFSLAVIQYASVCSFPYFWSGNVYSVAFYVGNM